MKITKYEHACLVVEEGGDTLVIDPGAYTTDLPDLTDVRAIVITHVHADHLDKDRVEAILRANPDAAIYTTAQAAKELPGQNVTVVGIGNPYSAGSFNLEFFGGQHAIIHESMPPDQNVGVIVNDVLYYPGDSFTVPGKKVKVLALPVSAPWMKLAEAIDFAREVNPEQAFGTHDAPASVIGHQLINRLIPQVSSVNFHPLKPGESLNIS